jgi:hypothetical protein
MQLAGDDEGDADWVVEGLGGHGAMVRVARREDITPRANHPG